MKLPGNHKTRFRTTWSNQDCLFAQTQNLPEKGNYSKKIDALRKLPTKDDVL